MATAVGGDNEKVTCEVDADNGDRLSSPIAKRFKSGNDIRDDTLVNFGNVKVLEIINENASATFLRCRVIDDTTGENGNDAVVILEKKPFKPDDIENIMTVDTTLVRTLQNDIYGTYDANVNPQHNGVKATVIYPVTQKHVDKYRRRSIFLVCETADDYINITLPFIKNKTQFSLQWVENILEHKTESDRIVFEDADKDNGFILLPDMKWNRERVEDLYLIAICHRRGVHSLRDLRADQHLQLLHNIRDKALSAIENKYGVAAHEIRVFLHYQPSYYHLHVHFLHMRGDNTMVSAERCHLLDTIIGNLELLPDYYRLATITYTVKEGDQLYEHFKAIQKFDKKNQ